MNDKSTFPVSLFLIYVVSYGVQAIYSTYLNLFFKGEGLSEGKIGLIASVSAAVALAGQLLWGVLSDRAKVKNQILQILYLGSAVTGLFFYGGAGFCFFLIVGIVFTILYEPTATLQDNLALEILEDGPYDFGKIRLGGTAGYCVSVLLVGYFLDNHYRNIFFLISGALFLCAVIFLKLKPVYGQGGMKAEKGGFKNLMCNRHLMAMIGIQVVFRIGNVYFSSFYPIHMTETGKVSSDVGLIMFVCALSEIPIYYLIYHVVERWGEDKVLIGAGIVTALRWMVLSKAQSMPFILLVSLFHGIGFTAFHYCVLRAINISVPKNIRATSQMMNAILLSLTSKVLFGYLNGLASETFGISRMVGCYGILMMAATALYGVFVVSGRRWREGMSN